MCLVSGAGTKATVVSLKFISDILVGAHQTNLFLNKYSLQPRFHKLLGLWFYFDFFLNLGSYYIAL